jgi:hypothetical protein
MDHSGLFCHTPIKVGYAGVHVWASEAVKDVALGAMLGLGGF